MTEKTVVRTERAPAPFQGAPYSQAVRAGELVTAALRERREKSAAIRVRTPGRLETRMLSVYAVTGLLLPTRAPCRAPP